MGAGRKTTREREGAAAKRRAEGNAGDEDAEMLNLGPVSRGWLESVGVTSLADLRKVGAVEAFGQVEAAGHRPSVNLLYALHAALLGLHWTMLPPKVREDLKRQAGR